MSRNLRTPISAAHPFVSWVHALPPQTVRHSLQWLTPSRPSFPSERRRYSPGQQAGAYGFAPAVKPVSCGVRLDCLLRCCMTRWPPAPGVSVGKCCHVLWCAAASACREGTTVREPCPAMLTVLVSLRNRLRRRFGNQRTIGHADTAWGVLEQNL